MAWIISLVLLVVYFLQGGYDYWLIIAASIFGVAGSITNVGYKICDTIKTKTIYDSITKDKSAEEVAADIITSMGDIKDCKNNNIMYFKHRDD